MVLLGLLWLLAAPATLSPGSQAERHAPTYHQIPIGFRCTTEVGLNTTVAFDVRAEMPMQVHEKEQSFVMSGNAGVILTVEEGPSGLCLEGVHVKFTLKVEPVDQRPLRQRISRLFRIQG